MLFFITPGAALIFGIVMIALLLWRFKMLGGFGLMCAIAIIGTIMHSWLPQPVFAVLIILVSLTALAFAAAVACGYNPNKTS